MGIDGYRWVRCSFTPSLTPPLVFTTLIITTSMILMLALTCRNRMLKFCLCLFQCIFLFLLQIEQRHFYSRSFLTQGIVKNFIQKNEKGRQFVIKLFFKYIYITSVDSCIVVKCSRLEVWKYNNFLLIVREMYLGKCFSAVGTSE